jgi:hypothetical protein
LVEGFLVEDGEEPINSKETLENITNKNKKERRIINNNQTPSSFTIERGRALDLRLVKERKRDRMERRSWRDERITQKGQERKRGDHEKRTWKDLPLGIKHTILWSSSPLDHPLRLSLSIIHSSFFLESLKGFSSKVKEKKGSVRKKRRSPFVCVVWFC